MEEKKIKKKFGNRSTFILIGMGFVVLAAALVIMFLLNGNVTVDNAPGDAIMTKSLVCESTQTAYPFASYDNSDNKNMRINVIFVNENVDRISLIYKLYYDDEEAIRTSETMNHANINTSFAADGLDVDSFGATYASLDDMMQMTFTASGREINEISAKYFLLEDSAKRYDRESMAKLYNSKGLDCIINN